ncbi:MAG: ATP-binding protein [Candidatus Paceibacter sp.]|nr:ATP-binding protein [Candidatus Paceibacter sp.]
MFIKRNIFEALKNHLDKKEMTLIVGPRQAGKTTLMMELKEYLEKTGNKTVFLSLDFENDRKFFTTQNSLTERLKLEFGNNKGYVFLDEIQRKEDAGLFLKGIYDMNLPHKFIISGSGSVELKEKVHESLAGRKMMFEVLPISFSELANFRTDYKYENRLLDFLNIEKDTAMSLLLEYLNFGGYPRVITANSFEEKMMVISELYGSYMEKDIAYLLRVEKLDAFSSLVKIIAGQTGRIINYSELSNTIGLSMATIKNYLWYLEKTFITGTVSPFFKNKRKEITKAPVVYFHDLGFRNYSVGLFGKTAQTDGSGFAFQNFVFNALKTSLQFSGAEIRHWRTKEKAEVDFVITSGDRVTPVEVKYSELKKPEVGRSLKSFIDKYKPQKAFVVNKSFKETFVIDKTEVNFIPFWELAGRGILD